MVFVIISVVHSVYSAEGDMQSGLPHTGAALKNPIIPQKNHPRHLYAKVISMELIARFELATSSLPSCDESRASPVFRHYLLRTNSYIIITEWF